MSQSPFAAVFPRQLRFWTFHCCLNALPSFILALIFLSLWKSPSGIAAMLCGVATFVLIYSTTTSAFPALSTKSGMVARSLHIGTKIRSCIAVIALVSIAINFSMMHLGLNSSPKDLIALGWFCDFWCGMFANELLESLVRTMRPWVLQFGFGTLSVSFMKIYLTTLIQGVILSSFLVGFSISTAIFTRLRKKRRLHELGKPR